MISGDGKRVMEGGVYYTLHYDQGNNFWGQLLLINASSHIVARVYGRRGKALYEHVWHKICDTANFYNGSDSLKIVIVYTALNESQ